jgi:hypothetical protein
MDGGSGLGAPAPFQGQTRSADIVDEGDRIHRASAGC